MIPRDAKETALRLARGFPILAITGPRQSGKTTLARSVFPDRAYVTLEDPDQREQAQADPRGFLARFADGAIIGDQKLRNAGEAVVTTPAATQATPTLLSASQEE